ncbi:MAG: DUF5343 domain-containing protein [Actinomycetota bacterium]|nr:DUF5343 domain-containing protein [Actinomycetota bacterium]
MGLAYVLNNGNLGKFLNEIVSAPVPTKVDYKYLETRGYTGKNDKYLVAFLKALGFIDKGGVPQRRWHDHRHTGQSMVVRGAGVREAYAGFFDVYPDAPNRTEQEFINWARVEDSTASPVTIKRSWATFRAMIPLGDFTGVAESTSSNGGADGEHHPPPPPPAGGGGGGGAPRVQVGGVGGITINIELQLPATADAKFFDQFFASMRKNLIDENE